MVHARALPWVRDVVPALAGLSIHFDPDHPDVFGDAMSASLNVVSECLKQGLPKEDEASRTVEVPVCYEREFAPDLAEIAAAAKVTPDEAVALHTGSEFRVLMIGFAPGHPYMAGLNAKLAVPRRATPRAVVPAGTGTSTWASVPVVRWIRSRSRSRMRWSATSRAPRRSRSRCSGRICSSIATRWWRSSAPTSRPTRRSTGRCWWRAARASRSAG